MRLKIDEGPKLCGTKIFANKRREVPVQGSLNSLCCSEAEQNE
jgi:hypothetical protein